VVVVWSWSCCDERGDNGEASLTLPIWADSSFTVVSPGLDGHGDAREDASEFVAESRVYGLRANFGGAYAGRVEAGRTEISGWAMG